MKETDDEVRIDLAADVLFDFDKADIRAEASETLTKVAEVARKPVAPNTKPDGSDDPAGRQKNRRVEITVKKR